MRTLRILIVEHSRQQIEFWKQLLRTDASVEIVSACTDGHTALRQISALNPDLVVCELILPHMDGLMLLEEVSRMNVRPSFILTSAIAADSAVQKASLLGADYFLLKPFDSRHALRLLHEIAENRAALLPQADIRGIPRHDVYRLLIQYGFASHMRGFQYIATGVQLASEEPALLHNLTKALYVQIADRHDTSAVRVERDIRHAILTACQRSCRPRVTSGAQIRTLVAQLKQT